MISHQGFSEEPSAAIVLGEGERINFFEFDRSFEHVFVLKNDCVLEKRAMADVSKVLVSINLEQKVGASSAKQLTLSDDG